MLVVATEMGFFGGKRIKQGQFFNVPAGVTGKWFTPVEVEKPAAPKRQPAKVATEEVEG